jgi:hypothetical protein
VACLPLATLVDVVRQRAYHGSRRSSEASVVGAETVNARHALSRMTQLPVQR